MLESVIALGIFYEVQKASTTSKAALGAGLAGTALGVRGHLQHKKAMSAIESAKDRADENRQAILGKLSKTRLSNMDIFQKAWNA